MKALVLRSFGPPTRLELAELPDPVPAPGEVLVRLAFSAVNPIDIGVRAGRVLPDEPARFPMILGWDGAGVVEALGPGVTEVAAGDRVLVLSPQPANGRGTHADRVTLPVSNVVRIAAEVSFERAAATPLAALTALDAVNALKLPPGATVHVDNPRGAVGGFAVQIAELLGLVVRDEAPVDGAIDVIGGPAAKAALARVRDGGAYATVIPAWWKPGGPYDPERGITPVVVENASSRAKLGQLATWLATGEIAPRIEAVLPLADGAEAHRRLEAHRPTNKLVLDHGT